MLILIVTFLLSAFPDVDMYLYLCAHTLYYVLQNRAKPIHLLPVWCLYLILSSLEKLPVSMKTSTSLSLYLSYIHSVLRSVELDASLKSMLNFSYSWSWTALALITHVLYVSIRLTFIAVVNYNAYNEKFSDLHYYLFLMFIITLFLWLYASGFHQVMTTRFSLSSSRYYLISCCFFVQSTSTATAAAGREHVASLHSTDRCSSATGLEFSILLFSIPAAVPTTAAVLLP